MLKRFPFLLLVFICSLAGSAQVKTISGLLTGNVMDSRSKALEGATVRLISFADTLTGSTMIDSKA